MSRSLVLGNGNMLVCFDARAQVRDLYFPFVGLENHINFDQMHRVGVFIDGKISWTTDRSWGVETRYKDDTMVSEIKAINKDMGLTVLFQDTVYNEKNIFLRNISITNNSKDSKKLSLFLNQEFDISENRYAETAYYNPDEKAIVHYKGKRVFLVGGLGPEGRSFDQYSVGISKTNTSEGSWIDAEDGTLSKKAIIHGDVDSTIGFDFSLESGERKECFYWIAAGQTFKETQELQTYVLSKKPEHLLESTSHFWHAWIEKNKVNFFDLDEEVVDLYKKSLLIVRTHCDNRGGIIASGDSDNLHYDRDTYAYVWPRDAAFIAMAMCDAGYQDISKNFLTFCANVLTEEGYILHKYLPDRSLASSWHPWIREGEKSLPIQEDETALPLIALWEYYFSSKDLEFIEKVYNSFIKKTAEFLMSYREQRTGLPAPSYGLWEESYGISTFTSSAVYGALISAKKFAETLGKSDDASRYTFEAEKIKKAILKYLYNPEKKFFHKHIKVSDKKIEYNDTIDASSFLGIFRFGVLPVSDNKLSESYQTLKQAISGSKYKGGVLRYEKDPFRKRPGKESRSNPWFITTLWVLQFEIERAETLSDLKSLKEKFNWFYKYAQDSLILSEQIDPETGGQISVAPLIWSHGEFIKTVNMYIKKSKSLKDSHG